MRQQSCTTPVLSLTSHQREGGVHDVRLSSSIACRPQGLNSASLAAGGRGAPGMDAVQRDTGRTRKTACGWKTTASAASTDTCSRREGSVTGPRGSHASLVSAAGRCHKR